MQRSDVSRFELEDEFVLPYFDTPVAWGPVGYVTYKRTYARPLDSTPQRIRALADLVGIRGTEEWPLTVTRVIEGMYSSQKKHCERYKLPWSEKKAQRSAKEAFDRLFNFKWLPPGRGLWMMGTDYVEQNGGAALNNCAFISTADLSNGSFDDPFTFCMDMSMLGVGVGFDTLGAGKVVIQHPSRSGHYTVSDSREGWVDLIRSCLNAYAGCGSFPSTVDYSQVRPAGTLIRSFGGTSSGPEPLERLVNDIQTILDPLVGQSITTTAIVDLFNAIGYCVVSGNVRRSAEIALGPATDEFLSLKDPDGNRLGPWSWCSNNSVVDPWGYTDIAKRIAKNGEPGIFWLNNARRFGRMKDEENWDDERASGTNPCSEQTLESRELCCLVETFPSLHESARDYYRTLKFAYLYAKTVTCIPTHDSHTNAVMLRNRRIGCSQSGITEAIAKFGARAYFQVCDQGYGWVEHYDEVYSDWLCIPRSIKVTSVKPSGSVSKLPGVSEGIHFPISEYYWQVIRFASDSPYLPELRRCGYRVVETNEPNTTAVYFPCKVRSFSKSRSQATMWEQLELTAQMQYWWADNQVSSTVTFSPSEASDIATALSMYEPRLKGISMLPLLDHGYEHAPQQKMTKKEYELAVANLKPLDFSTGVEHEITDEYCDGDSCLVEFD